MNEPKHNFDRQTDITILVNSCDLYEDAWYPFFYLLRKHWPACNYDIVLNTETKQYHDDYFNIKTINTGTELSWTARLRYVLNKIDTEYILFFLEDFFLITDVRQESFDKAVELISNNKDIGLIRLCSLTARNGYEVIFRLQQH